MLAQPFLENPCFLGRWVSCYRFVWGFHCLLGFPVFFWEFTVILGSLLYFGGVHRIVELLICFQITTVRSITNDSCPEIGAIFSFFLFDLFCFVLLSLFFSFRTSRGCRAQKQLFSRSKSGKHTTSRAMYLVAAVVVVFEEHVAEQRARQHTHTFLLEFVSDRCVCVCVCVCGECCSN